MDNLESLDCGICNVTYNDNNNVPYLLTCKENHTMCSSCITKQLNKEPGEFTCPWDREVIPQRNLADFVVDSDLLYIAQNFQVLISNANSCPAPNLCPKHNKCIDLVCIDCREKICNHCGFDEKHLDHQIKSLEEFDQIISRLTVLCRNHLNKINEVEIRRKAIIDKREDELIQKVEEFFEKIVLNEKKKQIDRIKVLFAKERRFRQEDVDMINMIKRYKTLLKNGDVQEENKEQQQESEVEGEDQPELSSGKIFEEVKEGQDNQENIENLEDLNEKFGLAIEEDILQKFKIEDWVMLKEKENEDIKTRVDNFKLDFDSDLVEKIQNNSLLTLIFDDKTWNNPLTQPNLPETHFETLPSCPILSGETAQPAYDLINSVFLSQLEFVTKTEMPMRASLLENLLKANLEEEDNIQYSSMDSNEKKSCLKITVCNDKLLKSLMKLISEIKKQTSLPNMFLDDIYEIDLKCEGISDQGLEQIKSLLSYLTSLRKINIYFKGCPQITYTGFVSLNSSFIKMNHLRHIKLDLHRFTPEDDELEDLFGDILKGLVRLKKFELHMSKCHRLTKDTLESLVESLESLDDIQKFHLTIDKCKKISQESIDKIQDLLAEAGLNENSVIDFQEY